MQWPMTIEPKHLAVSGSNCWNRLMMNGLLIWMGTIKIITWQILSIIPHNNNNNKWGKTICLRLASKCCPLCCWRVFSFYKLSNTIADPSPVVIHSSCSTKGRLPYGYDYIVCSDIPFHLRRLKIFTSCTCQINYWVCTSSFGPALIAGYRWCRRKNVAF